MRFYVPEWDDHVDAEYDFLHDEHSSISKSERDMAYIWDLFDRSSTPIDGVLISREQVEESQAKFDRLTQHGIYNAPTLAVPEWLPTISDCGAWGYKSLPFPPYGNQEMLEFYEQLGVTTGVTIDHLVLGSGHTARLYLDKRAFSEDFTPQDLPNSLTDAVDVMIDTWPDEWPAYVAEYEPHMQGGTVDHFDPSFFDGSLEEIVDRLAGDPRAVYRDDDMLFRYELTLENAAEMRELYDQGSFTFQPMVAIQGWDPNSYVKAIESVLKMGYQYIGIGGVAGSPQEVVEDIVSAVGNRICEFEREHATRIDTHVFGFAKTGAFETIGQSGVSSFDSASMLRAAWTGGENYHLDSERRYDAIRVRYPNHDDGIEGAVETALRGQEVLHALRAFDRGESIATTLREWHRSAESAIENLADYLQGHRWDDRYDVSRLRDVEQAFREEYAFSGELKASFSDHFRREIVRLLRDDDPESSIPWGRYLDLISRAYDVFVDSFPTLLSEIEAHEESTGEVGTFEQIRVLIERYAEYIDDEEHLEGYRKLLRDKPWRECSCPICTKHGIEVAIFRGNNRNRRRGFHNTRRFYDQFEEVLPKLLVLTRPTTQVSQANTIEDHLKNEHGEFWNAVHDLPLVEVGILTADGVHEWWDSPPNKLSFDPDGLAESLVDQCIRYQDVFIDSSGWTVDDQLREQVEEQGCTVHTYENSQEVRLGVKKRLGFAMQSQLSNY